MKYTIDASVLVKLVVDEEYSENALKLISDQNVTLYAPSILFNEVGSVLYKMARRSMIEKKYAVEAFENLTRLPIETQDESTSILPRILELSWKLELHFYDCLYVHTAENTGSILISSDQKLLSGAAKECNIKNLADI